MANVDATSRPMCFIPSLPGRSQPARERPANEVPDKCRAGALQGVWSRPVIVYTMNPCRLRVYNLPLDLPHDECLRIDSDAPAADTSCLFFLLPLVCRIAFHQPSLKKARLSGLAKSIEQGPSQNEAHEPTKQVAKPQISQRSEEVCTWLAVRAEAEDE